MTAPDESHTPLDQALDLFVYLPVGFMFELPRAIPRFIERGRRELHANARRTDPAALLDPRVRLDRAQAHARSTLRALGVLPPSEAGEAGDLDEADLPERTQPAGTPAPETPAPDEVDAIDPESLAIPGYESLSASQVMPRLDSLSDAELERVRRYEHDHRSRKTILNKIAQLQRAQ